MVAEKINLGGGADNRPLEVWTYPTSGDSTRVWAINPDLFGWDDIVTGSSVYQPLRFPGQYFDEETISWENSTDPVRPALHYNWNRTYDPYSGTYLQVDPMVEDTWEAYNYVEQNPVGSVDRTGLVGVPGNAWNSGHLSEMGFLDLDDCWKSYGELGYQDSLWWNNGTPRNNPKLPRNWGDWLPGISGTEPQGCDDSWMDIEPSVEPTQEPPPPISNSCDDDPECQDPEPPTPPVDNRTCYEKCADAADLLPPPIQNTFYGDCVDRCDAQQISP